MFNWDDRALAVLRRLERNGHRAVLVGGCVRDSLLGIPPHDYDAATSALPEEIMAACGDLTCLDIGLKHGTVTVLSEGIPVEVTTFRRETTYSDHRHPDGVEFTGELAEDLARRDFTVNAIAWEAHGLSDPFGGLEDLKRRLVRCVGDPDRRFEEDALRILRGLRLAAQLQFTIHPDTAAAIRRHAADLSHVARERVWAEFSRLLCSPGAKQVLLDFPEVVCQVIPELAPCVGFDQKNFHHRYDVYTHCVKALNAAPPLLPLRLAALLHDVGKPDTFHMDEDGVGHFYGHPVVSAALTDTALRRLKLPNALREQVLLLVERHDLPVFPDRKWVGRWLAKLGEENFFLLLRLKEADRAACADPTPPDPDPLEQAEELARTLLAEKACFSLRDLAVNGRDCMAAGLSGKAVGETLAWLLERVSEGELENVRELLLEELRKTPPQSPPAAATAPPLRGSQVSVFRHKKSSSS